MCTKCNQFNGTPEQEGLCSSCFKTEFPDRVKAKENKESIRKEPVRKWEEEWLAALKGEDVEKLKSLLSAKTAAYDEATGGDNVLSKRHCGRMEIMLKGCVQDNVRFGNIPNVTAMIKAGIGAHVTAEQAFDEIFVQNTRDEKKLRTFDVLIEEPTYAEHLSNQHLSEAIYMNPTMLWMEKLLVPRFAEQIFVTAKHIKEAKYRNSPTNGGSTKEGRALVAFLEEKMKERNKQKAAERKREREEEAAREAAEGGGGGEEEAQEEAPPPPKRQTRGGAKEAGALPEATLELPPARKKAAKGGGGVEAAVMAGEEEEWECKKLCDMPGADEMWLMSANKWQADKSKDPPQAAAFPELWSCGLLDPRHPPDHSTHSAANCAAAYAACQALEKQLQGWKPEWSSQPWSVFVIRPHTLAANNVSLDNPPLAAATVIGADVYPPGEEPPHSEQKGVTSELQALALKDTRSTFFDQRFYFTDRVDTKTLAKVKAATNQIKKLTDKNSCSFVQFNHRSSETYAPRVLIVGKTKPHVCEGGLLVVSYVDGDQQHYHHGSIKGK